MKRLLTGAALASAIIIGNLAHAAQPDPRYCEMVSTLAKKIADDRDRGVSYKAELGLLKGATEDEPHLRPLFRMAQAMAKMIYIENPRLTPEGAYKLNYVVCMSQK